MPLENIFLHKVMSIPGLLMPDEPLETADHCIRDTVTDSVCLHEGQAISAEDCHTRCKEADQNYINRGVCMHNVCFCEWTAPDDPYLCTYKTLEDSMGIERKFIKLIRESSLSDSDVVLTDEDSHYLGSSGESSGPHSVASNSIHDTPSEMCQHGNERISENECDRRCLMLAVRTGWKIKRGFCLNGKCRCRFHKFGICLSRKLSSLESRLHQEEIERFDRLAPNRVSRGSRIIRDASLIPFCMREENAYHIS
ncbi:hypothetical protein QAD02_000319 [Eretmocerus hayati]|uniref:Uncharacterized protein n=1 Tax=Eretmocerus hayati TaxID=131215 RepID=A0ACC2NHL8_9HYME|nr:hypothetical protein QAD02_000319 [Eretmocerus hayati]